MAISEQIELKDGVSGVAKMAADAVRSLGERFDALKRAISGVGGSSKSALAGIADDAKKATTAVDDAKKASEDDKKPKPDDKPKGGGGDKDKEPFFTGEWIGKATMATEQVTALGDALKSLGPAGEMGGAVVSAIGEIGTSAVRAASKIMGAFGKLFGGGKKGGGGDSGPGDDAETKGESAKLGTSGGTEAAAASEITGKLKDFASESIGAIVEMVQEMVHAVISSTLEFIKVGMEIAIEASSARGDTEEIFKKIMGEEGKSEEKYEELAKIGRDTGMGQEKAFNQFRKLVTSGFKADDAVRIVQAGADIDSVRGGGAGGKLNALLNKVKASGSMKMGDVKSAAKNLGLSPDELIKEMAQKMGKSTDTLKSELKKGIKGDAGIDAILNSVEKKYGGMAAKLAESIPETLAAIKQQVINLFDKVDLKPLENVLHSVKDALDSELGVELKNNITELFSAIFEALFGQAAKGGGQIKAIIRGVSDFVKDMAGAVKAVTPLLHAFVAGIMQGLRAMAESKGGKDGIFSSIKDALPTLIPMFQRAGLLLVQLFSALASFAGFMAKVVYFVVGFGVAAAGAIGVAVDWFQRGVQGVMDFLAGLAGFDSAADQFQNFSEGVTDAIDTVMGVFDTLSAMADDMMSAGADLVQGLVDGITSNASAIVQALVAAVSGGVDAVKKTLGIASPSKVFDEIGGYTAEGMEQGIDGGAAGVAGAANRMGVAAVSAASAGLTGMPSAAAAGAANGNDGGGGGIHIEHLEIRANDEAGGKQAAEAFERHFADKMRKISKQG